MSRIVQILFLAVALSAALLFCSSSIASVTAAERYVDLSGVKGNDQLDGQPNDCSNLDQPCQTVHHALQQASANDIIVMGCSASADTIDTGLFECPWDCSSDIELPVNIAHVTFRAANSSEPDLLPISPSSFDPAEPLSLVPLNGSLCRDTIFIRMDTPHSTLRMERLRFSKLSEYGISYPIILVFRLDGINVELDHVYVEDLDSQLGAMMFFETGAFSITIKDSYFFNISSEAAVVAWSFSSVESRSDVTIQNSRFEYCRRALDIFEETDLDTVHASIENSSFESSSDGAIFAFISSLEISNSTFNNNRAKLDGAAVNALFTSLLSITNSNFTGNYANGKGGAINAAFVSDMSVMNSVFLDNNAETGGAINCEESDNVLIQSSTFEKNTAKADAGALLIDRVPRVIIRSSTFNDNIGLRFAGAILLSFVENRIDIEKCSFAGNKAIDVTSSAGAVAITGENHNSLYVRVADCKFINSTAGFAGAFQAYGIGGTLVFENTGFTSNKALHEAGALRLYRLTSKVLINSCSFVGNEVDLDSEEGGTISIFRVIHETTETYSIIVNNTIFENNYATNGGAVFASEYFTAQFVSCIFKNNYALKSGGAIHIRGVSVLNKVSPNGESSLEPGLKFDNTTFLENVADISGGAINVFSPDVALHLSFSEFNSNQAGAFGGGVTLSSWMSFISDTKFVNNSSPYGGALLVEKGWTVASRATILSNRASNSAGGILVRNQGRLMMQDDTLLAMNNAHLDAGALMCELYSECSISSGTMIQNNQAARNGGGILVRTGAQLHADHISIEGSTAGGDGGALYSSTLQNVVFTGASFEKNHARRGGAFFLSDEEWLSRDEQKPFFEHRDNKVMDVSPLSLNNTSFIDNGASMAGGAWFIDGSRQQMPDWVNSNDTNGNVEQGSFATYGPSIASHPIEIIPVAWWTSRNASERYIFENHSHVIKVFPGQLFSIELHLHDYFENIVTVAPDVQVAIRLNGNDQQKAMIIAASLVATSFDSLRGSIIFRDITAYGVIGTTVTITVQSPFVDLDANLTIQFQDCPINYRTAIISSSLQMCESCAEGTFNFIPGSSKCEQCPPNVMCTGNDVQSLPNYWVHFSYPKMTEVDVLREDVSTSVKANELDVYFCANGKCLGGNKCSDNRDPNSPVCSACLPGFSEWSSSCVRCDASNTGFIILYLIFYVVLFLYLFLSAQRQATSGLNNVMMFFGQVAALIAGDSDILLWLKGLFEGNIASAFSWVSSEGSSSESFVTCPFPRDSYGKLLTEITIPVLLLAMWVILLGILLPFIILKRFLSRKRTDVEEQESTQSEAADPKFSEVELVETPFEPVEGDIMKGEPGSSLSNAGDTKENIQSDTVSETIKKKLYSFIRAVFTFLSESFFSIDGQVRALIALLLYTYHIFTVVGFSYFRCSDYGSGVKRLVGSTDIICGSKEYGQYMALFIIALVYAALLPLFILILVVTLRFTGLLKHQRVQRMFGGLFLLYKPKYFWFETLSLYRRFALILLFTVLQTTLLNSTGSTYIAMAIFLALIFAVHRKLHPFSKRGDNLAEELSLLGLLAISLLRGNSSFDIFARIIILLIIVVVLAALIVMMIATEQRIQTLLGNAYGRVHPLVLRFQKFINGLRGTEKEKESHDVKES